MGIPVTLCTLVTFQQYNEACSISRVTSKAQSLIRVSTTWPNHIDLDSSPPPPLHHMEVQGLVHSFTSKTQLANPVPISTVFILWVNLPTSPWPTLSTPLRHEVQGRNRVQHGAGNESHSPSRLSFACSRSTPLSPIRFCSLCCGGGSPSACKDTGNGMKLSSEY